MTLYLSKLLINAEYAPLRDYQTDTARLHSLIYSLFGDLSNERILWAEENEIGSIQRTQVGKIVLILSKSKPLAPSVNWLSISSIAISDSFLDHKIYRFKLKANCVKTKNYKRIAITDTLELKEWLRKQFSKGGCSLLGCDVLNHTLETISRGKKSKPVPKIQLNSCRFSGEFAVNDPSKFRQMFSQGIGKAKAFGFGLLEIAPLA